MTKGGIDKVARNVIRIRVRSNLGYLQRRGKVTKIGDRVTAQWRLAENN